MQIGEFAKICNTKISVLRHYDKEGLLAPDFIDPFTGYRYYSKEQIGIFVRISALKKAGFSLAEIKKILAAMYSNEEIVNLFEEKKLKLRQTIQDLEEAKNMLLEGKLMVNVIFQETANGIKAKSTKVDGNDFLKACEIVEEAIAAQGYQRISNYMSFGEPDTKEVEVVCEVLKLQEVAMELHEDIDLPFVNDESIIGKWVTVGEFAVKEDFYAKKFCDEAIGDVFKEIYFLPNGEDYWVFGWTKGKLIMNHGDGSCVNDYTTEMYDGEHYMFVDFKSYNYRLGGHTTVLVLRQLDHVSYSAKEIARKDDIDKPFVPDERVLGNWKAFAFCTDKEQFTPDTVKTIKKLWWEEVTFFPNGRCTTVYDGEVISGDDVQVWTKGYLLRKYNSTACAYELRTFDGVEYLIIEWKSGDYRWGGRETNYYVFVRGK